MVDQRKVKTHSTSEQASGTSKVMVDQRQAIQSKREAVHRNSRRCCAVAMGAQRQTRR